MNLSTSVLFSIQKGKPVAAIYFPKGQQQNQQQTVEDIQADSNEIPTIDDTSS